MDAFTSFAATMRLTPWTLEPVSAVKNASRTIMNTDDAVGRGMDFAIVTLLFFGLGFGLDRWLDTPPVFMIVFVVVALVGQFARMWYGYEATMRQLEDEHAAIRASRATRPTDQTSDTVRSDVGIEA